MKKEFGRTITNLRKKRNLSQKDAAEGLGISQSLLSHYEKGIRECGLDFVVRLADYYEVNTDYLLGRSDVSIEASDDNGEETLKEANLKNTYCLLNRKLVANSAAVIYSLLSQINNKKLSKYASDYLAVAEYEVFRNIYSIKENNPKDIFRIENNTVDKYCSASLEVSLAKIKEISENIEGLSLSPDELAENFPESFSSLNEIIKNAEKVLSQNFKI